MSDASFWDKAATSYAASAIKDMQAYEATLDRARHYLTTNDHLLEVGCGTGTTALKLASNVARVTATDISEGMLSFANRKKAEAGVTNVAFQRAEITATLPDAPFDAIFASSILHLVDDLDVTLNHLFRMVKPGGYAITKTACLRNMNMFILPMVKVMQLFGKAPHVLNLSDKDLEKAFESAGFEIVESGHFGKQRHFRFIVARKPE